MTRRTRRTRRTGRTGRTKRTRRTWRAGAGALAAVALLGACGSAKAKTSPAPAPPPDALSAPVQVAQTADGAVGYREVGSGPPLLMIMGYGGSIDAWDPPFVDALAAHHRVVMVDNAGIGKTAALPQPLTAQAMAAQVAAFIRTVRLDRPAVLGWSMGGFIAQTLAVDDPELVSRLILCATLPGDGHATLPLASVTQELEASAKNPSLLLGLLFPADQDPAGLAYFARVEQYPGFTLPSPTVDIEQLAVLATWTGDAQVAGHAIASLKLPTLVMDGDQDVLAPVANSQHLASTIPGAALATYPDAGHAFLFQDAPQVTARIDAG